MSIHDHSATRKMPVSDELLSNLVTTANLARDGRATEAESLLLVALAPELLVELQNRRAAMAADDWWQRPNNIHRAMMENPNIFMLHPAGRDGAA